MTPRHEKLGKAVFPLKTLYWCRGGTNITRMKAGIYHIVLFVADEFTDVYPINTISQIHNSNLSARFDFLPVIIGGGNEEYCHRHVPNSGVLMKKCVSNQDSTRASRRPSETPRVPASADQIRSGQVADVSSVTRRMTLRGQGGQQGGGAMGRGGGRREVCQCSFVAVVTR